MGTSTDAVIDDGLDARTQATEFLSVHDGFPGDTGLNEIAGTTRTALEWDAAASRIADNTNAETIAIPAGETVRWLGRFSLASGGTFFGSVPNGSTKALVAVALDTDTIYCAAHGFADDGKVVFTEVDGAMPGAITEGTVYFVKPTGKTTDTFQITTAAGDGTPVDITSSGPVLVYDIIEETFGAAGNLQLAAGAFDIKGLA